MPISAIFALPRFKKTRKKAFAKLTAIFCFGALFFSLLATANKGAEPKAPEPTALEKFFPFILIGLLFYFLFIRPQQKRNKRHGDFLSNIKRGDEVLTASGIYGRIEGLTDSFVTLEVAEKVRLRIVKSQIASYAKEPENKKAKAND